MSTKSKKKKSASKKSPLDNMIRGAFDFATNKVLEESKKDLYSYDEKMNFIFISFSNVLEAMAKAQTNLANVEAFDIAVKTFTASMRKIIEMWLSISHQTIPEIEESIFKNRSTRMSDYFEYIADGISIFNPYDYYQINYNIIDECIESKDYSKFMVNYDKFFKNYLYPIIELRGIISDEINCKKDVYSEVLPTKDILLYIPYTFLLDHRIWKNNKSDSKRKEELPTDSSKRIFNQMYTSTKTQDLLLTVPYQSFNILVNLLKVSIESCHVTEIGFTGYRLGSNNPMIDLLCQASKKEIRCKIYLELMARGETERNLDYIAKLLKDGNSDYLDIKTHYNSIKVHSKMMYIELDNGKTISVFSTGNYNLDTTGVYSDYHYISNNEYNGEFIKHNFELLWNSEQPVLSSISSIIVKEIMEEIEKGSKGVIKIQCNHLDNSLIIRYLKEAVRRGCKVNLIIRTTKGFTNKELHSKTIVGENLEHSRVYIFGKGKDRRTYLSSSDLLYRNLFNRFESYIKVNSISVIKELESRFDAKYENGQRYIVKFKAYKGPDITKDSRLILATDQMKKISDDIISTQQTLHDSE